MPAEDARVLMIYHIYPCELARFVINAVHGEANCIEECGWRVRGR